MTSQVHYDLGTFCLDADEETCCLSSPAAFELIPPEKRDAFRGEIGHILMKKLDPDVLDECLFEVVSLCNYSTETRNSKSNRLAQMNVQAGMKVSLS